MLDFILVGVGGFIGAIVRFIVSNSFGTRYNSKFPYGTLFINITGSFILGLFLGVAAHSIFSLELYRWFIAVGFCGGYTTFSTFTYETWLLLEKGKNVSALLGNLLGSYLLGLLVAILGYSLGNLF
jgi:CrcB protein